MKANRVLLLEPSHSERYPVSPRSIDLALNLAENIERIQVFVGEFAELRSQPATGTIYFKEHPTATHYEGVQETRLDVSGGPWIYPSFFSYRKKCEMAIK